MADCKIQGIGSQVLFAAVRKCSNLKKLTVDKNDLRTKNTGYLTSVLFQPISYLSMVSCNLGDDGGQSLADGLARSRFLKALLLSNNSISDEAAQTFAEALGKSTCPLEVLDLSKN